MDTFHQQAMSLILGRDAREAFDLTRENPQVVERYGDGLGQQMLLARRLCEAGAAFVTIEWSGGGLKMGKVVGSSSARAESCLSSPFGAADLLATIYHVLGIDLELQFPNNGGRPISIVTAGRPIRDLV